MIKNQTALILILSIIILGAVTNPSYDSHKREIKRLLNSTNNQFDSQNPFEILGNSLGQKLIDGMVDNIVSVNNYLVFSIGKAEIKGKEKNITFGLLGNVFPYEKINKKSSKSKYSDYKIIETPIDEPIENLTKTTKKELPPRNGIQEIKSRRSGEIIKRITWKNGEKVKIAWLDEYGRTDFIDDCLKGECD